MKGKVVLAILEGLIGSVCIFLGGLWSQRVKTQSFILACAGGCMVGLVVVDAIAGYAWCDLWYKECRK